MVLNCNLLCLPQVPPLIEMLGCADVQLKEMAAFALGRLAQNADNQAGIVQARARGHYLASYLKPGRELLREVRTSIPCT